MSDGASKKILVLHDYYSNSYIINDGFDKDHVARREFNRTQDGVPARELKKHSKLSYNSVASSLLGLQDLTEEILTQSPELKRLKIDINEMCERDIRYAELVFAEKVEYVKEIDQLIFRTFEILSGLECR